VVRQAATQAGLDRIRTLVGEHDVELVVIGLPLTLRGELGQQARDTEAFVRALEAALDVPVETYDERFTTSLAARDAGDLPEDARAAAHLLQSYLAWKSAHTS
jgi:putative Holliday junction resolvase